MIKKISLYRASARFNYIPCTCPNQETDIVSRTAVQLHSKLLIGSRLKPINLSLHESPSCNSLSVQSCIRNQPIAKCNSETNTEDAPPKSKKPLSKLANNDSNNKKNQDSYDSHGDYPVGSHPKDGGQHCVAGSCERSKGRFTYETFPSAS